MDSPDDNQKLVNNMVHQLEKKGYSCLVIAVGSTKHFQGGSKVGLSYLEKWPQIVVEFAAFVQDDLQSPVYAETVSKCNSFPKEGNECDPTTETTFLHQENFTFNLKNSCQAASQNIHPGMNLENLSESEKGSFKILKGVVNESYENNTLSETVHSNLKNDKYAPNPLSLDNLKLSDKDNKIYNNDINADPPSPNDKLQCDKCGKAFKLPSLLEAHKNRLLPCVDEDLLTLSSEYNESVIYKDKDGREVSVTVIEAMKILRTDCIICSFKTCRLSNLRRHFILAHCKERPFKCKYCPQTFKLQSMLNRHMSKAHVNKDIFEFSCELCTKTFLTEKQLKFHKVFRCEMRAKPGKCNICGYVSTSNAIMLLHQRLHTGEKPYTCPHCELTFVTQRSLNQHLDTHSQTDMYECKHCQLKLASKTEYNSHIKLHKEADGFQCSLCEKTFCHKSTLDYHMMIHSGSKPFMCDTCGKAFRKKERLMAHIDRHLGNKPYLCQVCKKGFVTAEGLRVHKLIHTERCHTCERCGKSFYRRGKLTEHYKIHGKS